MSGKPAVYIFIGRSGKLFIYKICFFLIPFSSLVKDIIDFRKADNWSIDRNAISGFFDDSELESYISEHKESGADILTASIQKQNDDWLKENPRRKETIIFRMGSADFIGLFQTPVNL